MPEFTPPQPGAGAPGGMPGMPVEPGPMAAPMSTPQEPAGTKQGGMVQVTMALELMSQALPQIGAHTEEGQAVLTALKSLSKLFGQPKQKELIPAEVAQMVGGLPQMGGGGPDLQAMMRGPQAPQQMMPPGGMPGLQ